jgi:hypothetical protein
MPSNNTTQRNLKNKFRKRRNNLVKKAYELSVLCDSDVALIIQKDGYYYTFRSKDEPLWPPTIAEIVWSYFTVEWLMLIDSGQKMRFCPT